jgi:hypothetical protein
MATKKTAAKTKAATKTGKAPVKKTAAKSVKKTNAVKKGAKYACEVCGLAVSVDNVCGCVESCDLICCGRQMKPKK